MYILENIFSVTTIFMLMSEPMNFVEIVAMSPTMSQTEGLV